MTDLAKELLAIARRIQADVPDRAKPPDVGSVAKTEQVLPFSLVRDTRGYIETVVHQINGTYEDGYYDACLVMIRRLLETLIIEAFEHKSAADKIKNSEGNFFFLDELIDTLAKQTDWNLSRNTKDALPRLKKFGDLAAHNRRFNAHRGDIEKLMNDLRVVVQELVYLADLASSKKRAT